MTKVIRMYYSGGSRIIRKGLLVRGGRARPADAIYHTLEKMQQEKEKIIQTKKPAPCEGGLLLLLIQICQGQPNFVK